MQNGPRFLTDQDISQIYTTTTPSISGPYAQDAGQDQLGALGVTADGRLYRYANIGGTSTVNAGAMLQQAAAPSNSVGLAINATNATAQLANGSSSLILTAGGTQFTQDQFANGFLLLNQSSAATNLSAYRVSGNTNPGSTTGAFTVQLFPTDALRLTAALVAGTDTVTLVYNPWWAVAASTTDLLAAGVLPLTSVGALGQYNFAWLQTHGDAFVNLDSVSGGVTAGGILANSTTTAGSVTAWLGAGLSHGSAQQVGVARATTAASNAVNAFLTIN